MFSKILSIVILFFAGVLYYINKDKQGNYYVMAEEYGFKFLPFFYVGLYIYEKLPYNLSTNRNPKNFDLISVIYGKKNADLLYMVHQVQKIVFIYLGIIIISFLVLAGETGNRLLFPAIILIISVVVWLDQELKKKSEIKKREILIALPQFTNSLLLLVNAGLPFNTAIEKIVIENDKSNPLYKELNNLLIEIRSGKPMAHAYEELAQRCRIPEITRFVSTVLQNLNKGTDDLVFVLKNFSHDAWEKRKEIARKQGEEAAAKLVFPMVLVFLAVTIIVLAPAVISMSY